MKRKGWEDTEALPCSEQSADKVGVVHFLETQYCLDVTDLQRAW